MNRFVGKCQCGQKWDAPSREILDEKFSKHNDRFHSVDMEPPKVVIMKLVPDRRKKRRYDGSKGKICS